MFTNIIYLRNVRFRPSGYSFTAPMPFLHESLLRKLCTPGLPFFSLPSEGQDGGGWSRDALVLLPEGFPLLPLDFGRAGRVEEPLVVRLVHGCSVLSPRFIRGLGIQELLSCGGLLLPVLSRLALLLNSPRSARCWGGRVFGGVLCSRLPLPPHLCTHGEVVGPVSCPSAAPVRVLPGLPILGLGSREGV